MNAPEKELRFTRARQAVPFWLLGVVLALTAAGLVAMWRFNLQHPPPWWAALFPVAGSAAAFWLAWRLTRHAYLLLSPVGVEIFPFFKPSQNYQLVPWGTIAQAEISEDQRWLTLILAGYEDVRIILTLDPLAPAALHLLERAVTGVMEKRESSRPPVIGT